jgi:hypothetical protein
MAVAALLQCHSASGTFAVIETEFGLNLYILADLNIDELGNLMHSGHIEWLGTPVAAGQRPV